MINIIIENMNKGGKMSIYVFNQNTVNIFS